MKGVTKQSKVPEEAWRRAGQRHGGSADRQSGNQGQRHIGTNGDWWRQVKGRHSRYANVEAAAWSQGLTFGAS